ncbi:beta-lactamase family protein [Myxococcus stipitatus]|uniref:serine hydrolase domain-containing protein n=1 Tax=Myxococcus stipitatus TaxID=83455 RepID=UPI001F466F5F|nr:serine hydrolase domain-containing protein [Myxococcus stipitatus]MCE9667304.1 beta-lactamase family protein [Myxococcus stipitatus]
MGLTLLLRLGIAGLVLHPAWARAADDSAAPLATRLQAFVDQTSLSGVVCAFDATGTVAVASRGVADARTQAPLSETSLFRIGSLSKTVLALALFRMAEQGEFDLHATSAPALAWVLGAEPEGGERLPTHEELLHHTSGLRDPPALWLPYPLGEDRRVSTARELLPLGLRLARATAPGERFAYANLNYALLGEALRLRTGTTLEVALRQKLFAPLGLRDLGVTPDAAQRARLSQGHFSVLGRLVTREAALGAEADAFRDAAASGNLFSSCGDLAALLRAALWGPLFEKEPTRRQWLRPALEDYAAGAVVQQAQGHTRVRHAGAVPGFTSFFEVDLEARRGFIVLSNLDVSAVDESGLSRGLRELVLTSPPEAPPRDGSRHDSLFAPLRLGIHAALAPTLPGRVAQGLVALGLLGVMLRKPVRSRLETLAESLGMLALALMLSALTEMSLAPSGVMLVAFGLCGAVTLKRAAATPWWPPRLSQRVSTVLSLALVLACLAVGVSWAWHPPASLSPGPEHAGPPTGRL